MPKVTGQAVPPELQALYTAITSPKKITQGPDGVIRLKKGKKAPKRRTSENLDLVAFQEIGRLIAVEMEIDPTTTEGKTLIYTITEELSVGYVNPAYFTRCEVDTAETLVSYPTSVVDPDPPPYGYRTINNYPTRPTYPDGVPDNQPQSYTGHKIDTLFKDTHLAWRKISFKSRAILEINGERRVVMKWQTRIDANAGSRGSRPMLSLNIKGAICGETGSDLLSTAPPLVKKTSLYWRFKVPKGVPPYWTSYQVRNILKPFARFAKKSGSGLFVRYLLNASNRPMEGRGFNNNDNVFTTFDKDPELWEISDCFLKHNKHWKTNSPAIFRTPRGVAYNSVSKNYAVCAQGGALISSNLTSWTWRDALVNTVFWGICYAEHVNLYVMVGHSSGANRIMTSPTGSVWTERMPNQQTMWQRVAASPSLGRIVALGIAGNISNSAYSNNGIAWGWGTSPELFGCAAVEWIEDIGLFVAGGSGGEGRFALISADGIVWQSIYGAVNDALTCLAWSQPLGLIVAGYTGNDGNGVQTSSGGGSWSKTILSTEWSFNAITWAPPFNAFIASTSVDGPNNVMISANGTDWAPLNVGNTIQWTQMRFFPEACRILACTQVYSGTIIMNTSPTP